MNAKASDVIRLTVANSQEMPPRFRDMLEEAFVILSESPTARPFLEKARASDISVFYGRGLPFEGVYNHEKNAMLLGDKVDDAAGLAMTMCHELRHFSQITASGVAVSWEFTPMTMLKLTLAAEADARAHELQLAFEMAAKKTAGGKEAHPGVLELTTHRLMELPDIRKIVEDGRKDPAKIENGEIMAEAFKNFYASRNLRYATEERLLELMAMDAGMNRDPDHYKQELSSKEIFNIVAKGGPTYLGKHLQGFDLDGPYCSSVYEKTAWQLEFMKSTRDLYVEPNDGRDWKPAYIYKISRGNPRIIPPSP